MRLILLAPPGAGKGTQGAFIQKKYHVHQISTGDILREHIIRHTKLGKQAAKFMDAGELVPDDLILDMLNKEIVKDKYSKGFMLDGFPRNFEQAEELDMILDEDGLDISAVLILNVPKRELVSRLSARISCPLCGRTYHLIFHPPIVADKCDEPCGGILFQRPDDNREAIINRLKIYESKIAKLVDYYEMKGLAHNIDGVGGVHDVFQRVQKVLDTL